MSEQKPPSRIVAEAYYNDTTVHQMMASGRTMEEIVAQLAREKADQFKWFMERLGTLQAIAPRKIKTPDGRVFIYRCPDHLVPEADL